MRDTRTHLLDVALRCFATIVWDNQGFFAVSYRLRMEPAGVRGSASERPPLHATMQAVLARAGVFQHFVLDPGRYPLDAVIDAMIRHWEPRCDARTS